MDDEDQDVKVSVGSAGAADGGAVKSRTARVRI